MKRPSWCGLVAGALICLLALTVTSTVPASPADLSVQVATGGNSLSNESGVSIQPDGSRTLRHESPVGSQAEPRASYEDRHTAAMEPPEPARQPSFRGSEGGSSRPGGSPVTGSGRSIRIACDVTSGKAELELVEAGHSVSRLKAHCGIGEDAMPEGTYSVRGHLGTVHTNIYGRTLGHEFFLENFLHLRGNYGIHRYKLNEKTGLEEPGPTHGCIALSQGDAKLVYEWALDGTPVEVIFGVIE